MLRNCLNNILRIINMKTIKNVYLYRDSHLPEEGWLQSCFRCYSITGKLFFFKTIENKKKIYQFKIYMCPSCQKKNK